MRTDAEWIESYLLQELNPAEEKAISTRRAADPEFRQSLFEQAKVHLAALLYGRSLRRMQIFTASEQAFCDPNFVNQVKTIFK
jgi:hypothetical protein